MTLHRMNSVTIGVPNVAETAAFYRDFNLTESTPGVFASADGGDQLRLVHAPLRRLVEVSIGAENQDDIDRVASQLSALNVEAQGSQGSVSATDPVTLSAVAGILLGASILGCTVPARRAMRIDPVVALRHE